MPRLIDAEALCGKQEEMYIHTKSGKIIPTMAVPVWAINNAPVIDAEPVVRCRGCRERCLNSGVSVQHCTLSGIQTEDDDYCSYGAKMDGGTEC